MKKKPRRVIVTLELTTSEKLVDLRDRDLWKAGLDYLFIDKIHQVQVNVVKEEKGRKKP